MTTYVIDASVVLKWLIPETHSEPALRVKHAAIRLHAPALLTLEVANVLSKKRRRGEVPEPEIEPFGMHFGWRRSVVTLMIRWFSPPSTLPPDQESLYDNLYLALAIKLDIPFLTADQKF